METKKFKPKIFIKFLFQYNFIKVLLFLIKLKIWEIPEEFDIDLKFLRLLFWQMEHPEKLTSQSSNNRVRSQIVNSCFKKYSGNLTDIFKLLKTCKILVWYM